VDDTSGAFFNSPFKADEFRDFTLDSLRKSLSLPHPGPKRESRNGRWTSQLERSRVSAIIDGMQMTKSLLPDSAAKAVQCFHTVARTLKEDYSVEKRAIVMDELEKFVEGAAKKQQQRMSGGIATVEKFWEFRVGSSAVGVVESLIEYVQED
jgi:hypothetical protein